MIEDLPSEETMREHAYLVARGVRPCAIAGHCHTPIDLLRVATLVERNLACGAIPFVVDHRDGTASFGYAAESWVIDLYTWAVTSAPLEQADRIVGLLLGYAPPAITRYEQEGCGRRFELPAA